MYTAPLADSTFHDPLLAYDRDLADLARGAGCACGGVLNSATYPRKPRPRLRWLRAEHSLRFSFCCAVDGCESAPLLFAFSWARDFILLCAHSFLLGRHGVGPSRALHGFVRGSLKLARLLTNFASGTIERIQSAYADTRILTVYSFGVPHPPVPQDNIPSWYGQPSREYDMTGESAKPKHASVGPRRDMEILRRCRSSPRQ